MAFNPVSCTVNVDATTHSKSADCTPAQLVLTKTPAYCGESVLCTNPQI